MAGQGPPLCTAARVACPSEAEWDEAAGAVLARPARARQWTEKCEREIRETRKVTARLSEQALDLKSWHDAMRSEPWKKRHARLKAAKKSAVRMRRDSAGGGRPHAPHGGGGNQTLGMKSTLTLLRMPPTMHGQITVAWTSTAASTRDAWSGQDRRLRRLAEHTKY